MAPETRFYQSLRNNCPPLWHWQRIESPTGLGIPDVNLFIPKVGEVWLELKSATKPIIRSAQHAWIKKRMILGSNVAIVFQFGKKIKIWDTPNFGVEATTTQGRLKVNTDPNYECEFSNFAETLILSLTKKTANQNILNDE